MFYAGSTLDTHEDIEGQVVVDFEAAFTEETLASERPQIEALPSMNLDDYAYVENCEATCCLDDRVVDDTFIDLRQARGYVNSLFPKAGAQDLSAVSVLPQNLSDDVSFREICKSIQEDELLILSFRVFGFILRNRKFEGVAEMFGKPLFQITCGDLGTTAKEVEKTLESNFALANRWGCILLLDEADVFLAERTKEDFVRNGLVAVFLRVLEYYSGILFLTTNRVGDFDEAFTSRIHMSLYYPELSEEKTRRVFKINMDLIRERFALKKRQIIIEEMDIGAFATQHYINHPSARWNGRQIRNACQTALALAEYQAQGGRHDAIMKPDAVINLAVEHFETVRDAYLKFAEYMNKIYGTNAARKAKEGRLRAILIDENDNVVSDTRAGGRVDRKEAYRQSQSPFQMGGRHQHENPSNQHSQGYTQPSYQTQPTYQGPPQGYSQPQHQGPPPTDPYRASTQGHPSQYPSTPPSQTYRSAPAQMHAHGGQVTGGLGRSPGSSFQGSQTSQTQSQFDDQRNQRFSQQQGAESQRFEQDIQDMNLILNQANLATLSASQPITNLPKTFREAFVVLERLQLEYLWNDRFCILHDSEEDWLAEASEMHNVYANSIICISALGAEDDDGGLFFSRDPLAIKIPVVNIPIGESNKPVPLAGEMAMAYIRNTDSQSAVLSTRGWVLQERILAPRVLHFGKSQVLWECNTSVSSEAQPKFDKWKSVHVLLAHPDIRPTYKRRTVWKTTIGYEPPSFENPIDCIFIEWYYILDYYNNCHLTKSDDKLVATSAIAKDMKKHLSHLGESSVYLGGLWRSRMPRNLLWQVSNPAKRPERYRAPSWSWASVDNASWFTSHEGYSWFPKRHRVLVSVIEATTTPLTSDDTGQLQGGSLTLKCRLLRAVLAKGPREGQIGAEKLETIEGIRTHHQREKWAGYLMRFDTVEDERCSPVLFVPIQVEEDKENRADESRIRGNYYGLVLEKSGNNYKRIGKLRYDVYEPTLGSWFDDIDVPWGKITIL
ncbi:P-loop containing nucleoside triphosphate hydrolase protein [Colletotrichum asianum]